MTALASRSCDANVDAREAPTVLCRFFRHGVQLESSEVVVALHPCGTARRWAFRLNVIV